MSEISNLIFHEKKHRLSSPYGKRAVIKANGADTAAFHNGADYSTYGIKLAQYAVADGEVLSCGIDSAYGGAKYVWVRYPSLGVKMLHYHLDSVSVRKGQSVNKSTVLGTTGKTGYATGIHLHLGIKRLSGGGYIDPEEWSSKEYPLLMKKAAEKKEYKKGNYRVSKAEVLHVRAGAGTTYAKKTFRQLSQDAQKKIKLLSNGRQVNGYVKGLTFTVTEIKNNWGKTPSGWVCLDYCEAIA